MKWFTRLFAVLTALALCVMPAFADVVSGGIVGFGLLGLVVVLGVIALLAALLARLIGRKRQERKKKPKPGDKRERK